MKKKRDIKKIPVFFSEAEEADFWDSVDSTAYFPGEGKIHLKMPRRTQTISLRLPHNLIGRLKKLAGLKDVPYQSLLKIYLDEKIRDEISTLKGVL